MTKTYTAKVDPKGRLTIPQSVRDNLGIEPGDVLFIEEIDDMPVIQVAKAENPFDGLVRHAEQEYRAGKTRNLREFARDNDIDIDVDVT